MLRSSLCDYSDAYILVKGTIVKLVNYTKGTIIFAEVTAAAPTNANKKVILKTCAPFTKCMSRINNTQFDDAHYIDAVMPMYNLIEYSDNYSKISGILWQFYRDVPAVNDDGAIADFIVENTNIRPFNLKVKLAGQTGKDGTKKVKMMVPLK